MGCCSLASRRIDDLVERRDGLGRRHAGAGIGLLRSLVDERSVDGWAPPESELERLLHEAVASFQRLSGRRMAGAAPWARRMSGSTASSDRGWSILEADGRRWHARVADFDRDTWRDNRAAALGYRVLRFTLESPRHRLDEVVEIRCRRDPAAA